MKRFLFIVFLIFPVQIAYSKQVYSYSYLLDKYDDLVVLDIDRKQVSELPYGNDMEVCEPDSSVHCFKTPKIWFAVPKEPIMSGQSWVQDDIEYRVVSESKEILGFDDVFLIEAQYTDVEVKTVISSYLYSNSRGLLFINVTLGNQKPISLILSDDIGFPK
ncbi:MAG: hypothetical protein OQJ95_11745 [Kangiella sp.]|jgi:hypothetical protein|nr:hypothetical protein [Kangiella sp.]